MGINAVDATLDAFTHTHTDTHTQIPTSLQKHGRVVHLVNFKKGRVSVRDEEGLERIQGLESVCECVIYGGFEVGEEITPTVDIRSDCGYVLMMHESEAQIERDYAIIQEIQKGLFQVLEEEEEEE
jgi:hypothetical protein